MAVTDAEQAKSDRHAKAARTRRRRQIEREHERAKERRDRDAERAIRAAGAVARRAERELEKLLRDAARDRESRRQAFVTAYRPLLKANQRAGSGGRTFHLDMPSLPASSRQALIDGLSYDDRDEATAGKGRNQARRDELEAAGESHGGLTTAEMTAVIHAACDAAGTRANGVAAHRCRMELPIVMSTAQRIEVAQEIAQYFEKKGLPCHWAIHLRNAKKEVQPHLHFTVPARPVRKDFDGTWTGTKPGARGRGKAPPALGKDKKAMMAVRADIAAIINRVADRHDVVLAIDEHDRPVPWHGGTLKQVGIDRPAKGRIPYRVYRAREREAERGLEHRPMSAAATSAEAARAAIDSGDPAQWDRIHRERQAWAAEQKRDASGRRQDKILGRIEKFYRSRHPAADVLKDQGQRLRKQAKQEIKNEMAFNELAAQRTRLNEEVKQLRKERAKLNTDLISAEAGRGLKETQRKEAASEAFDFEQQVIALKDELEAERQARETAENRASDERRQREEIERSLIMPLPRDANGIADPFDEPETIFEVYDQAKARIAAQEETIAAQQGQIQAIAAGNDTKNRISQKAMDFACDALVALGYTRESVDAWKPAAFQDEALASKIFAEARPKMAELRQASKARSSGKSGGVER